MSRSGKICPRALSSHLQHHPNQEIERKLGIFKKTVLDTFDHKVATFKPDIFTTYIQNATFIAGLYFEMFIKVNQ